VNRCTHYKECNKDEIDMANETYDHDSEEWDDEG
jgi:hypothetical protein